MLRKLERDVREYKSAVDRILASEAKRLGEQPDNLRQIIVRLHFERRREKGPLWKAIATRWRRPSRGDVAAFALIDERRQHGMTERSAVAHVAKVAGVDRDALRDRYRRWKKDPR